MPGKQRERARRHRFAASHSGAAISDRHRHQQRSPASPSPHQLHSPSSSPATPHTLQHTQHKTEQCQASMGQQGALMVESLLYRRLLVRLGLPVDAVVSDCDPAPNRVYSGRRRLWQIDGLRLPHRQRRLHCVLSRIWTSVGYIAERHGSPQTLPHGGYLHHHHGSLADERVSAVSHLLRRLLRLFLRQFYYLGSVFGARAGCGAV
mmetsp:Transcript_32256/g.51725  ORF Transcript_32256/g.51725 Transcript_32256/m.51725 type:complete len:206 (-) Transcript_32256:1204-1821(-)